MEFIVLLNTLVLILTGSLLTYTLKHRPTAKKIRAQRREKK